MASILETPRPNKSTLPGEYHLDKATTSTTSLDGHFRSNQISPADSAPFHDTYPLSATTPKRPALSVPEPSAGVRAPSPSLAEYMRGNGNDLSANLSMPANSTPPSESGRPSVNSRQRSQPSNQLSRRPPSGRPPFSNPPQNLYPAPSQNTPEPHATSSGPPSAFAGPSSHYPSPPTFRQRGSFVGPQYTLSHAQPPMNMVHSPPPFAFPHHHGMPGQETNMQHLAYPSPSMMPILQQHAPLYPYQGHSPDVASSSQHTFTSGAAPSTLPVYSHVSVNPSPPPHSPLSPQQSSTGPTGGAQHSAPYASPGAFTPVGYATPPQYAYPPPPSFAPTPPIYGSQYTHSHYPQPYGSPGDQDGQGTWWYLPPNAATTSSSFDAMQHAFRQQFNLGYPSMGQQQEDDIYAQSTAAEQPASSSPAQPDQRPLGESPPEGTHEDSPTPLPASLPLVPQSKATESPSVGDSQRERQQVRRSYHPNPPAHRSEWVMWAGNVPSDATHDELWRFFNQPLPSPSPGEADTSADQQVSGGVSSIFLISRSNCAFINFATEAHLNAATARFHGQPIRPNDQRCPRLVCRVRRRTDDLRAGVGAQRGNGIHIKWVREQKEKARSDRVRPETANSPEEVLSRSSLSLSVSDDDSREPGQVTVTAHSNSSGSFASTNSSILTRYFPRRFFILKSLTQYDLDLSVQKKVWATQRHNEEILDQAYRTSKDVFLIFGVNKSGEFYGYARMAGPISHSDGRIAWASPSGSSGPSSRTSAASGANLDVSISPLEATLARRQDPRYILPPEEHRVAEDSPQPESHSQEEVPVRSRRNQAASAPAELHDSHRRLTHSVPIPGMSLNVPRSTLPPQSSPFQLNPDAPYHALKNPSDDETRRAVEGVSIPTPSDDRREASEPALGTTLQSVAEEPVKEAAEPKDPEEVWGRPFPVEWIHTERLPFFRTRHLRNPWNHGREVKVSRDGTELEPAVGQQLLDEWDRPPPSPAESSAPPRTAPQRRGARSAQHPP